MENFLTVIVPALNEEGAILNAINSILTSFKEFDIRGECLVIDDGSTDQTAAKVRAVMEKDPRVRMLGHATPQSLGGSFWAGVDAAQGDILVLIPGDNETNARDVLRYVFLIRHVDMVITYIYNKENRPFFRKMISALFRSIVNMTFRTDFKYTNGSVIYRKSILKDLPARDQSFFFQADLLIRLVKKGYLYAECPFKIDSRQVGRSKAISLSSLNKIVKSYFRLIQNHYLRPKDFPLAKDSATYLRRNETRT